METGVEKRKRMKAERLRRAARFSMVFISAAVLILAWAALTTAGGSAGTLDTTPPKMLAIASDEPVAEAVRLTLHVDHESEEPMWSQAEVEAIAKTVYGEAMVTGSDGSKYIVHHRPEYREHGFAVCPWHYQLAKLLDCWLYQTAEDATYKDPLRLAMKEFRDGLYYFIVMNSPQYVDVQWGELPHLAEKEE